MVNPAFLFCAICPIQNDKLKIGALTKPKKLALRYRQKIFTTNNHYEWSKEPVVPEMPYL